MSVSVLRLADIDPADLRALFGVRGLAVEWLVPDADIPGSYWGDSEAGLVGDTLYVRPDTPVHSALHEACHWLCMDASRRSGLHTDADGDGDDIAECALLPADTARRLPAGRWPGAPAAGHGRLFRLGSAGAWFERDAGDARDWLRQRGLIGT